MFWGYLDSQAVSQAIKTSQIDKNISTIPSSSKYTNFLHICLYLKYFLGIIITFSPTGRQYSKETVSGSMIWTYILASQMILLCFCSNFIYQYCCKYFTGYFIQISGDFHYFIFYNLGGCLSREYYFVFLRL